MPDSSPALPPSSSGPGDRALRLLWLAATAHQALFQWIDGRIPGDQGRYYTEIPHYYWDLERGSSAAGAVLRALTETTGWYALLVAGALRAFGRSPWPMEAVGVGFYGLLLAAVALVGRRLAGPAAGLAAMALTAALPMVTIFSRKEWIHVPEAALVMCLAACWAADPGLARRRTVLGLALTGALAILLRQSGLIWIGLAGIALAASLWRVERNKTAIVLGFWGLATLPLAPGLALYISRKVIARARYAAELPSPLMQVGALMGALTLGLIGLGLVMGATRPPRRAPTLMLAVWALVPVPLVLIFKSGIDNFTPFAAALCVGAGVGLTRWSGRLAWVPVAALASFLGWQWVGAQSVPDIPLVVPQDARMESLIVRYHPTDSWGVQTVGALLDASCTTDEWRGCHVVVDQGLFMPTSEEFGLLELFLLGEDRVGLRTVYEEPDDGWASWDVDAFALFRCKITDWQWWRRSPDLPSRTLTLVERAGLAPAWWDQVQPDCGLIWFTRGGIFPNPEAAPQAKLAGLVEPWSVEIAAGELQAFQEADPGMANARGWLSVVDEGQWDFAGPPVGWTAERGVWHRARARGER